MLNFRRSSTVNSAQYKLIITLFVNDALRIAPNVSVRPAGRFEHGVSSFVIRFVRVVQVTISTNCLLYTEHCLHAAIESLWIEYRVKNFRD